MDDVMPIRTTEGRTFMPQLRPGLRTLARPRAVALACIAVLAATGWAYLGLALAGQNSAGAVLQALCRPLSGAAGAPGLLALSLTFAMWAAMALAMMLPTAGPMMMTYADLAETAAAKGEPAASPLVLAAGYLVVWLGAALMLAGLQSALARFAGVDDALLVASPFVSGALFIVAGAYQFTAMKRACLTQCQNPFTFFFANWATRPGRVFRLGAQQGLYCLGCCWAMMLLMFAVGIMNVIWMGLLGIVMATEKLGAGVRFSRALGIVFLAAGAAIIVQATRG